MRIVSDLKTVGTTATAVLTIKGNGKVKKLWAYNAGASDATLRFCDSDGNATSPAIVVTAGGYVIVGELDLPAYEFNGTLYMVASADVEVMVEVEA